MILMNDLAKEIDQLALAEEELKEEQLIIEKIQKEDQTLPTLDIDLPGHLNNLSEEQHHKLLELWSLVIDFLSSDSLHRSDEATSTKQNRDLVKTLQESNQTTSSLSSQERSEIMDRHPLSGEFWIQFGTDHPDVLLLRFLRARKWHVPDAFSMFYEACKWRSRYGVRKILQQGDMGLKREILESGKGFFWGLDKHRRQVIYLVSRFHNRNAQTLEETCRYTVYQMEVGRRLFQVGSETTTIIFDMSNAPLSSLDFGSVQFMIQCFQNYYPESLGRCLIYNAPWIFWGFYKLVKPLLDPVVVEKIIFIENAEHLHTFIDADQLLESYGGACPYKYQFLPPPSLPSPTSSGSSAVSSAQTSLASSSQLSMEGAAASVFSTSPNGPQQLSDMEMEILLKDLEAKKIQFIDQTMQLISESSSQEIIKSRREQVIKELMQMYKRLDKHYFPETHYHRLGVIQQDDSVVWPSASNM